MNVVRIAMQDRPSQDIRYWVSDEIRELQCHILRLRSLHNSTLPPQKLPAEILVQILRCAFGHDDRKWMVKVAGVCRHWKDVIIGTPLLWTNIDLPMNQQYMELFLARSQEANLHIRVPFQEPHKSPDLSAILSALAPHHPRISQVNINMGMPSPFFQRAVLRQLMEASLPALTSLSIDTSMDDTLQLSNSRMPNIRKLKLGGFNLQWASWPLPGLTSLHLIDVTRSRGSDQVPREIDISSILDVLEACNSLEIFKYEGMLASARTLASHWSSVSDKRVVSLPCVQDFSLVMPVDHAAVILAHVTFPRKARISIRVGRFAYEPGAPLNASLLTTVLPSDATRLPIIADARHITVWLVGIRLSVWVDEDARSWGYNPLEDEYEPDPPTLSLGFAATMPGTENDMFHNVVLELCSIFPSSVESLIINGPVHLLDVESWGRILAAFPLLQYLELYSTLRGLEDFVPVLKPATRHGAVPWARLQDLYLECTPPPRQAGQGADGDDPDRSNWEILKQLRAVLQERSEANSRLKHLYIDLKSTTNCSLHSVPETATSNTLSAAAEEVRLELSTVVDSLELYD